MYVMFSDAAKFADIARNWVDGSGYGGVFSFWYPSIFEALKYKVFSAMGIPPIMPYSIAAFFKIFGVGDFAVIATSFFYFLLTLVFVYLLGKKIFESKWVGALSALAVGASYDLIHYATNGASESPFIFEIVAGLYFASLKKKWANVVTILFLILMYFTRPQAFIYISGIVLYWLLINFKPKKAVMIVGCLLLIAVLVDYFILLPSSGRYFLYSILGRGLYSGFNQSSTASDALRGAAVSVPSLVQTAKNIFYNLYNFYKALPEIVNPYLFVLFVIGLLFKAKAKEENAFKIASVFMVVLTFLVVAASIPFYRYLHPVIPLIYIVAVATIVEITKTQITNYKQITIYKLQISKQALLVLGSCLLVLFFGVGQTVGKFVLDSRFEAKTHNVGRPPVYVELSYILKDNTSPNQVVVTNLDTWGSWYGERRTVWFPVEPKQIIDPATGTIPFDAIYLTSYLIDDPNYYMGTDWRMIFENPDNPKKWTCDGCVEIAREFKLKGIYKVNASEDYERASASAILFVKK